MSTIDGFRKYQKRLCLSGAPNHVGIYGCYCCRKIRNLNKFKKWARKVAKSKFRQETQNIISGKTE